MKLRRMLCLVLAAVLMFSLCPMAAAEGNLLFVAVNDSIPLTLTVLPYYSGGTLYVPYTVFDAAPGSVNQAYNVAEQTFVLFTRKARLVFDLEAGTAEDENGIPCSIGTTFKNGVLYVPLYSCISHFGLNAVMLESADGYQVLRFTTGSEVYDNSLFLEKAENLIAYRIEQYAAGEDPQPQQQPQPQETDPADKPPEGKEEEPAKEPAVLYPAFLGTEAIDETLSALEALELHGAFFLTASEIEASPELIRTLYVSGHKIGLTPEANAEDVSQSLRDANDALDAILNVKSLMALVPEDRTEGLTGYRIFSLPATPMSAEDAAQTSAVPTLLICRENAADELALLKAAGAQLLPLRETTVFPAPENPEAQPES